MCKEQNKTYVSFTLYTENSDDFSTAVNVKNEANTKFDQNWTISSGLHEYQSLDEHVNTIVNRLVKIERTLLDIPTRYLDRKLLIAYYIYQRSECLFLDKEIINYLSKIDCDLELDLYDFRDVNTSIHSLKEKKELQNLMLEFNFQKVSKLTIKSVFADFKHVSQNKQILLSEDKENVLVELDASHIIIEDSIEELINMIEHVKSLRITSVSGVLKIVIQSSEYNVGLLLRSNLLKKFSQLNLSLSYNLI